MILLLAALAAHPPAQAVALWRVDPATAVDALAQSVESHPPLRTALQTLLAESLLASGRRGAARRLAEQVRATDRRWAARAAWTAARAAMPDDCRAAIAHIDAARPDPPWIAAAPRLALLVEAHRACSDERAGDRVDRTLAVEHPHTAEGQAAGRRVPLTASDRLEQAAAFERARDYGSARETLTALVGSAVDADARFALARLHLERLRADYDVATRGFTTLAADPGPFAEESAWLLGRTRGRAGDVGGALAGFAEYLQRYPSGRFAADARFFAAFLRYEHGRYAAAATGFGAIRRGKWADAAAWYHAWCTFLSGADGAAKRFDRLAHKAKAGSGAARRAAYWAARALEERAPKRARKRRARIVAEKPHGWYALLIRRRFPNEFKDLPAWPSGGLERGEPTKTSQSIAAEVRSLEAAGLRDFARRALGAASGGLRRGGEWALETTLAADIGDYERLYRATVIRHRARFRGPHDVADAQWWRAAWPVAHAPIVATHAGVYDVAPDLVYSFMRKESAFDVDAVSPAHAIGLMQLLPRTGRRIVERTQGELRTPDLFNPEVNIALGTWYVSALQARFGGQLPLVAAAYNAGPESVVGWLRGASKETDIFVERIPFRETRGYVKRMVETQTVYRWVHGGMSLAKAAAVLPTELDTKVAPGVDF